MTEAKTEQWLHCECRHEWIVAYLPMEMALFARVLKSARCPLCGSVSKKHRMGKAPKPTGDGDFMQWLQNGDTGVSSETIWSVMTGHPVRRYDIPYDPSDFGRCYRLLKVMPSWRERLTEVGAKHPRWMPFVRAWDELTALFEDGERTQWKPPYVMYERMKVLESQAVAKAGDAPMVGAAPLLSDAEHQESAPDFPSGGE